MSAKLFDKLSKEAQVLFCQLVADAMAWAETHLRIEDYNEFLVELDKKALIVIESGRISFADDALDEVDKCLSNYLTGMTM